MNEAVRVDKAALDGLTDTLRAVSADKAALQAENEALRAEVASLRALVTQQHVGTQDEATEPEDAQ